jgi:hypothetical protein
VADEPNQLAFARILTAAEAADAERVRLTEASMLDAMEERRRYEEIRRGGRLRLEHLGFRRYDGGRVLECRANMLDDDGAGAVIRLVGSGGELLTRTAGDSHLNPPPARPKTWNAPPPDVPAGMID